MKLKLFRVINGGPYNEETPFEADFEKGKHITVAGDSGVGKTTALDCFKLVLGAVADGKTIEALVNKDSGKLEVEQSFVGKDRKNYFVKMTKSQFYVREEGGKSDIPQPKSFIESHLGRVAADPMKYKNADVGAFVKWLAGFSDMGEEGFEKQYLKYKETIRNSEAARATANKQAKAICASLTDAGYMDDAGNLVEAVWVAAETKYAKPLDLKKLSAQLDEAGKRSDRLIAAETKLKQLKTREEQLLAELAQVQADIKRGEKYVEENADAKKQYDEVRRAYDDAAVFAAEYEAFQTARRWRQDMYDFEQVAQRADAAIKDAEKKKKELWWNLIPDTRGAEIVLDDEPDRKAGFYVNGFSSRQQSATQYLVAVVKILRKLGCKILVVDDTATYGSDFIKLLNQLSKEGWYILQAEMRRNTELTIEY